MGAYDVLRWLYLQRKNGNKDYFRISEVADGLKSFGFESNLPVGGILLKWESTRPPLVEAKMSGDMKEWHRTFRLNEGGFAICKELEDKGEL